MLYSLGMLSENIKSCPSRLAPFVADRTGLYQGTEHSCSLFTNQAQSSSFRTLKILWQLCLPVICIFAYSFMHLQSTYVSTHSIYLFIHLCGEQVLATLKVRGHCRLHFFFSHLGCLGSNSCGQVWWQMPFPGAFLLTL